MRRPITLALCLLSDRTRGYLEIRKMEDRLREAVKDDSLRCIYLNTKNSLLGVTK